MTKAEWEAAEQTVMNRFNRVVLICDGYRLSVALVKLSHMKLAIGMWINGEMKADWMGVDCDERRRFFRPYTRSSYKQKQLAEIKKCSKRQLKQYGIDPNKTFTTYLPWWTSFKALKSHLIKNNTSIELVEA